MAPPGHPPAEPFFIEAGTGSRFCLFHPPQGPCRGALVYLHPFAEEMNRSRRMAALAARALAASGVGVLQVDLLGCGDSSGDFADARWDAWKADVRLARDWLHARLGCPVGLWGLRLGALLALDCARDEAQLFERLLLWQPVTSGSTYLTQFLRLRLAGAMLQDDGAKASTSSLREELHAGVPLEIAGYTLSPELAMAIDSLDAASLAPPQPVHWIEMIAAPGRTPSPASTRVIDGWRAAGVEIDMALVCSQPFWASQEIAESPELAASTVAAMREAAHA